MASENELYHCRAELTTQNVISKDKHGEFKIDLIWKDKTKGTLRVYDDRLVFKNAFLKPMEMPYRQMRGVLLLSTKIMMVRCHILWIVQEQGDCGFSLLRNKFWEGPLPFRCFRGDAKASHASVLKEFSKGLVTGGVGEIVGGAIQAKSIAGAVAGEIAGAAASEVTDDALDKAGDQVKRMRGRGEPSRQPSQPCKPKQVPPLQTSHRKRTGPAIPPLPPRQPVGKEALSPPTFPAGEVHPNQRYIIRHAGQESAGINKATLIRIVQSGKFTPSDEVWDLAKRQKISSAKLIEKYG